MAAGAQLYRKSGFALDIPLHLQQAFGIFGDAADIGAIGTVDSDAAATGDQTDDAVAGNRGAAFAEADHQVLHALDTDATAVAAAEYAAAYRLFGRDFADNLARRQVATAQGGVEVLRCGEPKCEGRNEFDVSMPQEFPCYYDIVGKSYSGGRQDLMSSKPGLVAYLEGCIALAHYRLRIFFQGRWCGEGVAKLIQKFSDPRAISEHLRLLR